MFKCLVVVFFVTLSAESLIITVDQGTLNGTYSTTRRGKKFNAFYGIPFAQPPIGKLRFKPPKEAKPWNGILDATVNATGCVQTPVTTREIAYVAIGSEDCLNLNVYSPLGARGGDNLSVIVNIVGGCYHWYTNMDFGPEYILERNVILVVPNFRLGALGLMNTGDSVMPGNNQFKDQILALKWVQKNIHRFGGNPNDVSLHGHSFGSRTVHLHAMSPLSKGLFHKAIMQSGVGIYEFYGRDVVREVAKEFAKKAECPDTTSSESIYSCLMKLDAKRFPLIEQTMYIWDYNNPVSVFKPSIEDANSEEPFLTELPSTAGFHTPNMPWIIGLTTGEAAYQVARFLDNDGKLASEIDQYYKLLFPLTMEYLWYTKASHLNYDSQILRTRYFGNREIGEETAHQMVDLFTHGGCGYQIIKSIRSYPGPKYVYWYDYLSNYSTQNIVGYYKKRLGVCHGEDIYLLYRTQESQNSFTDRDIIFSEELVNRWVNFVQSGNPNMPVEINRDIMSVWEPMTTDRIEFLRIKMNGSMETDLYKGTYDFWNVLPIYDKYNDQNWNDFR